ncbi:hypothetical protein [Allosphingosinicella deserti]|uniref:Uncharacterized protein n=1 Tax=Allosphingosinicella deserti TaxID=2116704 RepID=A0A2P7QSK7_9SPHN|nr:hypothetical protein [Sphingomonas deserti]PSJ40946.1 hypothetical protein C7I55_11835 [Sphingomonas deserti]
MKLRQVSALPALLAATAAMVPLQAQTVSVAAPPSPAERRPLPPPSAADTALTCAELGTEINGLYASLSGQAQALSDTMDGVIQLHKDNAADVAATARAAEARAALSGLTDLANVIPGAGMVAGVTASAALSAATGPLSTSGKIAEQQAALRSLEERMKQVKAHASRALPDAARLEQLLALSVARHC